MASAQAQRAPARLRVEAPSLLRGLAPVGAGVACATAVGLAAASRPVWTVVAVLGAAFVPVVLASPISGLCVLLFLSFFDTYSAITGPLSLTKIVGLLLVFGWLGAVATGRDDRTLRGFVARYPGLGAALVLLTAWAAMSLVWAEEPAAGRGAVSRFALNFVLFPIVLLGVRTRRHVVALFVVFVAGSLLSVILGLMSAEPDNPGGAERLKGAGLNPNQLGALLVVAIVFSMILASNRRWRPVLRLASVAAAVFAAIGLDMTLSRGSLLSLGVAVAVAPVVIGRGRRAVALFCAVAAIAGTVGWFGFVAPQSALDRVTHPERGGGSGRVDLWRVGWRMVDDHPIRGIGAGNFTVSSIHYLLRPGPTQRDAYIVATPRVPHNIYLNVLAELGVVGFGLFAFILVACLWYLLRAAWAFAAAGDAPMEILARGLLIAMVGLLVADFFSSELYSKQLWLLLALGPALLAIADRRRRQQVRVAGLERIDPVR